MNILVIGSGGREHALCWKLRKSAHAGKIFCAPGNAGTAQVAENIPIGATDISALAAWASSAGIDLTVVGPEAPLAEGIVDVFRERGLRIFGPTRAAARLETSKAFAKDFMQKHRIPTAEFRIFHDKEYDLLRDFLRDAPYPLVLKADGLAAGKGVLIVEGYDIALETAEAMLRGRIFGEAGRTIVAEEYLTGIEASVFALTDGNRFVTLAPAQDHKRILDGDMGKNTGGMGAYAPTPFVPTETLAEIKIRIIKPAIDGMRQAGTPYTGVLYIGLMLTDRGPKVLEFNCRFGDPETQVVLPLLEEDLAVLLDEIARGDLQRSRVNTLDATAVCVVMASSGYPDAYETGKVISGLEEIDEEADGVIVFHSGTKRSGDTVLTAGGRVLGVTAIGPGGDLQKTIGLAYRAVQRIRFDGAYYRMDIGRKGIV
ncbi:MAG: phosphoribosylamine--glycine ligase [Bacteroidota bacterium]|nr:phosphoribosylamine--glycine ligase [Bacteroidota bacterium]